MIRNSLTRILVIGRVTLDIFVKINEFPAFEKQTIGKEYKIQPGGSALNVAVALASLGIKTSICSRIGNDHAGGIVREALSEHGINLSNLLIDKIFPTSISIINISKNGEIGILHYEGANKKLGLHDVPLSNLDNYNVVHIGGAMLLQSLDGGPAAEIFKQARKAGVITSLNTTRNTERKSILLPIFPYLDLIFMNKKESLEISGCKDEKTASDWFHRQGVKIIAITLGIKGVYVSHPDFKGFVSGFRVPAVDTTGCGDAFAAGFLDAMLRGMNPKECAIWGNCVGTYCARTIGALVVPFNRKEIGEMIKSQRRYGECAALVLAGGYSKRMQDVSQKLTMDLCSKPLIVWIIENLRRIGIHRIVVILGHEADEVKSSLRQQPVEFIHTSETDHGTGWAVQSAVSKIPDLPDIVFVINGDTPLLRPKTLIQLRKELIQSSAAVTVCTATTSNFKKYGHGAIVRDEKGSFERIEHYSITSNKIREREINTGTYCFTRDALIQGCYELLSTKEDKIHFSNILSILKRKQLQVKLIHFTRFEEFISVNTKEHLYELEGLLSNMNLEK